MECEKCGVKPCRFMSKPEGCVRTDCWFCHCEFTPDQKIKFKWTALEESHEEYRLEMNFRKQSFVVDDMIKWIQKHDSNNPSRILKLLESQLQLKLQMQDSTGQSQILSRIIEWVEINDKDNQDRLLQLLEKQLKLNIDSKDLKGQSIALSKIIHWCETYDLNNHQRLWSLLETQLEINLESDNFRGQSIVISKMIEWVETYDSTNIRHIWELLKQKLEINISGKELLGQSIAISKMIEWVELNDSKNFKHIWDLLEILLEINIQDKNTQGQSIAVSKMIEWVKVQSPQESKKLWSLFEQKIKLDTESGYYVGVDFVIRQMLDWIDEHSPNDHQAKFELLERKLNLGKDSGDLRIQSVALAKMFEWSKKNSNDFLSIWKILREMYDLAVLRKDPESLRLALRQIGRLSCLSQQQVPFEISQDQLNFPSSNPFDILFHLSTLMLMDSSRKNPLYVPPIQRDSSLSDTIIMAHIALLSKNASRPTFSELRIMLLKFENGDDMETILHRDIYPNKQSINTLENLQQPFIIDGPNLSHQISKEDNDSVSKFINSLNRPVLFYVSLNMLRDFRELIEHIYAETECILLVPNNPYLNEDMGMLVPSLLSGGIILSNDRFRDEMEQFNETLGNEVFLRKLSFVVDSKGAIMLSNL